MGYAKRNLEFNSVSTITSASFMVWPGGISNFVSFAMSGSNNLAPGIALNILSSVFCEVTTKRTLLYKGNLDYFFRNKWIIHPGKCIYACSLFELKLEHKYNIYGGVILIKYM